MRIIQGLAITRGRIKDWCKFYFHKKKKNLFLLFSKVYRADPYVKVNIVGTPNQAKQTKHVQSSNTPRWDETLQFYVDPYRDRFVGRLVTKLRNIISLNLFKNSPCMT